MPDCFEILRRIEAGRCPNCGHVVSVNGWLVMPCRCHPFEREQARQATERKGER
jgi:hypothetical protein